MGFRPNKGVKAIAAFVMFAVAQISVQVGFAEPNATTPALPSMQQFIARLRTRGNNPITVNSNSASTGASLVTGALIETGNDQAATIDIGDFTLDIAPNTKLRLDFDDQGKVKVFLIAGCVIAASKGKNTEVEVETADNVVQGRTERKRGGGIDICFINGQATVNQNSAANAGAGAGSAVKAASSGGGLSTGAVAAIVVIGGIAAVGTAIALSGDDEETQTNPSPSSPQR